MGQVAFEEQFMDLLTGLPDWFIVGFISMVPFVELRGALPVGFFILHMPMTDAFLVTVTANMIPVPFILTIFVHIEKWLRRWKWWDRTFTRLFKRTRRRAKGHLGKWGVIGIWLFVGIPLPFTGAWTGSLISYLFGLDRARSTYVIFVGVWTAGIIVGALCLFFASILGY